MKIAVIPDLHFRQYLCKVDLISTGFWSRVAEEIQGKLFNEEIDCVVFLGDMFHRWSPTPREIIAARDFVDQVISHQFEGRRPAFIVSGNHDYGRDRNNASELFGDMALVADSPRVEDFEGVKFVMLPYPNKISGVWEEATSRHNANFQTSAGLSMIVSDMLAECSGSDQRLLFSHVSWANSVYSPGQPVPLTDVAVSTETFDHWTQVFGGHIHLPQDLHSIDGKVSARYVGAVTPQNFGDDFCGQFCIWESESNEVETIRIESSANFVTWDGSALTMMDDIELIHPDWGVKGCETCGKIGCTECLFHADAGHLKFHRWRWEVSEISELYRLRHLFEKSGMPGKFEVTVKRNQSDEPRRFAAAESTDLKDVFEAYVTLRPDEIPESKRKDVCELIAQLLN